MAVFGPQGFSGCHPRGFGGGVNGDHEQFARDLVEVVGA